eukprot:TRINITY_DN14902_c1_g1_i5.p1 TRINITY_DN14902_c1_g1~~TRINITY_DN14902_c1_g1_i5.p1  ORF type:complete len:520 (+),score=21.49 TRINITY_DN14902_c1_g1_i5:110-1561(+)
MASITKQLSDIFGEQPSSLFGRVGYAAVEGLVTPFSLKGLALALAVHQVLLSKKEGVGQVLQRTIVAVAITSLGRSLFVFFQTRKYRMRNLKNPFYWRVPKSIAATQSSDLWNQLCHLALSMQQISKDLPDINKEELPMEEWLLRILALWNKAQQKQEQVPRSFPGSNIPLEQLQKAHQMIKFAEAVYLQENESDLSDWLKEREFELVYGKFKATTLLPAYAITIDNKAKEVVIVIRGTYSWDDIVTDLVGNLMEITKPNSSGVYNVHSGMGKAAKELATRIAPTISPLYKGGYQITVVGHSLGAGVGGLVTYFLRNDHDIQNAKAFCFACPAFADWELSEHMNDYVVSIVNRDDVVPRMQLDAVHDLAKELLSTTMEELKEAAKCFPGFVRRGLLKKIKKRRLSSEDSEAQFVSLYVPGQVWYEHYEQPSEDIVVIKILNVKRTNEDIRQIKLTSSLIAHHYVQNFQIYQRDFRQETLTTKT